MKTTMASAALLLVLALALVSAPLTAEAQKKKEKKKDDDSDLGRSFNCSLMCKGRKGTGLEACMATCELGQKTSQLSLARLDCNEKCFQQVQKGATKEATKVCHEQCEKDYKAKAAVITAACAKACEKRIALGDEGCKLGCTPPP